MILERTKDEIIIRLPINLNDDLAEVLLELEYLEKSKDPNLTKEEMIEFLSKKINMGITEKILKQRPELIEYYN